MNRRLTVVAAIVCLGAGAVGCSSSSSDKAASPTDTTSSSAPAAGQGAVGGTGCNAAVVRSATNAMGAEKDELNQTLSASDASVKITKLTSDDSCFIVLQTNAQPGDAKAKTALKPVDQAFSQTLPKGAALKGVKITAVDGSVLYQSAAQ